MSGVRGRPDVAGRRVNATLLTPKRTSSANGLIGHRTPLREWQLSRSVNWPLVIGVPEQMCNVNLFVP
jgi:hypothetical protein